MHIYWLVLAMIPPSGTTFRSPTLRPTIRKTDGKPTSRSKSSGRYSMNKALGRLSCAPSYCMVCCASARGPGLLTFLMTADKGDCEVEGTEGRMLRTPTLEFAHRPVSQILPRLPFRPSMRGTYTDCKCRHNVLETSVRWATSTHRIGPYSRH